MVFAMVSAVVLGPKDPSGRRRKAVIPVDETVNLIAAVSFAARILQGKSSRRIALVACRRLHTSSHGGARGIDFPELRVIAPSLKGRVHPEIDARVAAGWGFLLKPVIDPHPHLRMAIRRHAARFSRKLYERKWDVVRVRAVVHRYPNVCQVSARICE